MIIRNPFIRQARSGQVIRILIMLAGLAALFSFSPVHADRVVKIGVLAFRPKIQTMTQWQHLAGVLTRGIPGHRFEIEAYSFSELDQAVADSSVDFIFTNPGQFVTMNEHAQLALPLATLCDEEAGKPVSSYGGVIFTLAANRKIQTLRDLTGTTIAAASKDSLGGYQMQVFEMQEIGLQIDRDAGLILTGMPHDRVVDAVLEGRADVGFVRTGVLEDMAAERKLDLSRLRIINQKYFTEFPVVISTQLYPEWPFAALPHVEEYLSRHVTAALFNLDHNRAATRAMGINGFVVPADYSSIAELLRALHLPPFDGPPKFTIGDVGARYRWQLIGAVIAGSSILFLLFRLWILNRRLNTERMNVIQQQLLLRESEARWQFALEGAGDGVWDWNALTNEVFFSRRWKEMLGYSEEEIGSTLDEWDKRVHPDDREKCLADLDAHFQGKTPVYKNEHRMLCKDGSYRWILDRGRVIEWQPDGKPLRIVGTHSDVTERRRYQSKIEQMLAEQNAMLENQLVGIVTSRNRKIVWANPAFEKMLGYEKGELVGAPTRQFYSSEETYQSVGKRAHHEHKNGKIFRMQLEFCRHDGEPVWVDLSTARLSEKNNETLWAVIDITQQRNAEIALRESEKRFHLMADSAPVLIWMSEKDGQRSFFNRVWLTFTGRTLEQELCGGWMQGVHPDDLSFCMETFEAAFAACREFSLEYRLRRCDGEFFWVVDHGVPRYDEKGDFLGFIGSCIDITDRHRMETVTRELANYDVLTHLPNRRLLSDRLIQTMAGSKRSGEYAALMIIDLDNFKPLNDTFGHAAGDLLLIEAASRLKSCVREIDTVARFGGDEFIVILSDLGVEEESAISQAGIVAERIRISLADPYVLAIHPNGRQNLSVEHRCTSSIGIVMFLGHEDNQDEIIERADTAMYQAKKSGRNQVVFQSRAVL